MHCKTRLFPAEDQETNHHEKTRKKIPARDSKSREDGSQETEVRGRESFDRFAIPLT
jgi:hypothetical protein